MLVLCGAVVLCGACVWRCGSVVYVYGVPSNVQPRPNFHVVHVVFDHFERFGNVFR